MFYGRESDRSQERAAAFAAAAGQLVETDVETDPMAELSGVYRHVGAGGTVMRPTKEGPAMIFNRIKGHPQARVVIGVLASRKRVAALLDTPAQELGKKLCRCAQHPLAPVMSEEAPPCQEVVHRADEPGFSLYDLIPAPTNTPDDAGPYITMECASFPSGYRTARCDDSSALHSE